MPAARAAAARLSMTPAEGFMDASLFANLLIGLIAMILVVAATMAVSLAVRRRSPYGGYFSDSDRAAAIFAGVGGLFSVLLALVVFLSVESYNNTRSHGDAEADAVLEQFQIAKLFPSRVQWNIQSKLVCYARSVSDLEWPLMESDRSSPTVVSWESSIDDEIDSVSLVSPRAEAGFRLFLEQTLTRHKERRGRLEGAAGALPVMVWPVLLTGALSLIALMISYSDRAERVASQAFQIGLVTAMLASTLLLINALDHPFSAVPGKVTPDKMRSSIALMETELADSIAAPRLDAVLPCGADGTALDSAPPIRAFPSGSTMAQIVERGRLTVGVSYAIPLFGEIDPLSGNVFGVDNDLVKEIARELGLRPEQIEFVELPPPERLPALQERRVDMVVEAITITPERRQLVDFSRPYFVAGQSLLVNRSNRSIAGLRDLAGKKVCVIATSTGIPVLQAQAPKANLVEAPSPAACLEQLLARAVDAMTTDDVLLAGLAAQNDGLLLVGGKFTVEPYGVGLPKGSADMVAFVDDVIDRMIDDGRWGRIYYEYLADIPGLTAVGDARQRVGTMN